MAYCAAADIRNVLHLDSTTPSSTVLTDLISKADHEIDEKLESVTKFVEKIRFKKDNPYITLKHDFKEIKKVFFNEERIREYNLDNLLSDPDVEEGDDSTPEYWTDEAGDNDTLSWATDQSFARDRSLKIEKGGAGDSYWYSDTETVNYKQEWVARARIKVDSNSSGSTHLKLVFKDVDGDVEATHTSNAVSIEITQPSSAGTVSVASSDTDDTTQAITIDGLVNSLRTSEAITLNGTTSVSGTKSFSHIYGVRKSAETEGTVTVTRSSTVCTLTAKQLSKEEWIETEIVGQTTDDTQTAEARIFCDATSGDCWGDHFRIFKRQWKPLYASKQILFFKTPRNGELVIIEYERSQKSHLIKELSRDLSAMYSIVHLVGAKTAGMNLEDLKARSFGLGHPWKLIFDDIMKRFEDNLNRVLSYDSSSPMFIMSKTVN